MQSVEPLVADEEQIIAPWEGNATQGIRAAVATFVGSRAHVTGVLKGGQSFIKSQ